MPALLRGLDLSVAAGSSQGLIVWIMFKSTFFMPFCIACQPKQISQNATIIAQIWPKSKKKTTILAALS